MTNAGVDSNISVYAHIWRYEILRRIFAGILVVVMVMSLVGCKEDKKKESAPKEKKYTYNISIDEMYGDYNPHTLEKDESNPVDLYCQMGLVDEAADVNGKFVWAYEMAEGITDITGSFGDKGKYGIQDNETGRVWQIKLNKAATWEDGKAINADTYLSSMKLMLDSKMKNTGAYVYYDEVKSDVAIYNAKYYYNNDLKGQPIYALIYDNTLNSYAVTMEDVGNMYISLIHPTPFWGYSLKDAYNGYGKEYFTSADGTDYYKIIEKAVGDNEYVLVNEEILAALQGICKIVGDGHTEEFMEMLYYKKGAYEEVSFDNVGLVKVDDYTLNYITAKSVSEDEFLKGMTKNWIVDEEMYVSTIKEDNGLSVTDYGKDIVNYKSYGPYKLVNKEEDKLIMTKNESWYGYSDGKHDGQFQTTDIVAKVVSDSSTREQMFIEGKLDELILNDALVNTYKNSQYKYTAVDTCTYRWIFATDFDKLVALEKNLNDGTNKLVLSYDGFRKALSYALDREKLCEVSTSSFKPAIGLLSEGYYLDDYGHKDSKYRDTLEAKQALVGFYGLTYGESESFKNLGEAYDSLTGYDAEKAKEMFKAVYDKAISDGNYKEGQPIKLRCMVSSNKELTKWEKAEETAVNEMLAFATKGTGFEGMLTVEYVCGADNRYNDCVEGKIEMIKGAWSGSAVSPYTTIGMYTLDEYAGKVQESCGFDPASEVLGISYDFDGNGEVESINKTYREWTLSLIDENQYANNEKVKLIVLTNLEMGILSQYQCIPLNTETFSRLISQKINYGFKDYNIMYEYGGIRYLTYNYDDDSFKAYIKEQGDTLKYQ